MAEALHVVGPLQHGETWVFLCPTCDDDRLTDLPAAADRQCTTDWLTGQLLAGDSRLGNRSCHCWHTDPYEGEKASGKQRRFFHYRTIAFLLGAAPGQRVDLPGCVKDKIEELFGESLVGFRAN